ncbi:hypothetical protein [Bradyrhizobium japonicum]|uniref:hypothetical protein n=1 Tax=Bradyrhizobium japonicum TaxID=375 RepID=UPI0020A0BAE3|nr:hypothetical protein [Bradyrhizobium japonicum]MCP1780267.1 hypothetical protein [Bradyrhizobium japonicum]MCP1956739.1 hypothetical protein [Bradyrhizobium japonicum]
MNRPALGILLAGGLLAATAVLVSPVAASLGRYSEADSIRFSWSRTTGVNPVGRSKSPGYGHLKLPHLMIAVSAAEQQ